MIQDAFWRTALRWAWLIVAFGIAGAVIAYVVGRGSLLEASDEYAAATTLGVSRVLSPGGVVTPSGDAGNADAINRYATALIQWTATPQYDARVEEQLRIDGIDPAGVDVSEDIAIIPEPDIPASAATVNVRPIPTQSLAISATSDEEPMAQALVTAASTVLRTKAAEEERQLRDSLLADAERTRQDLLARLNTTYEALNAELRAVNKPTLQALILSLQQQGLNPTSTQFATILQNLARVSNNPGLIYLQSQVDVLQQELSDLGQRVERLQADAVGGTEPLIVTAPPETAVQENEPLVSRRGLLATGAVCGLLLGWLVANVAEQLRVTRAESQDPQRRSEVARGRA